MKVWEIVKQHEFLKQEIESTTELLIKSKSEAKQLELVGRLKLAKHELKAFERIEMELKKEKLHKYGYCARCASELKKEDYIFCKPCKKEVGKES